MTQFEWLVFAIGICFGGIVTHVMYIFPMKRLRRQLYKLRGQVYYWSRQMPIPAQRGRPAKKKSV